MHSMQGTLVKSTQRTFRVRLAGATQPDRSVASAASSCELSRALKVYCWPGSSRSRVSLRALQSSCERGGRRRGVKGGRSNASRGIPLLLLLLLLLLSLPTRLLLLLLLPCPPIMRRLPPRALCEKRRVATIPSSSPKARPSHRRSSARAAGGQRPSRMSLSAALNSGSDWRKT